MVPQAWLGTGERKETGTSQARPGQASTMVGLQPCCVPALLLLLAYKHYRLLCASSDVGIPFLQAGE